MEKGINLFLGFLVGLVFMTLPIQGQKYLPLYDLFSPAIEVMFFVVGFWAVVIFGIVLLKNALSSIK